jgi:hypothetical protein
VPITGVMLRPCRLIRLVTISALLAFAALPAAAANAALVFSPNTTLTFDTTTAGMQTMDQTLTLTNTSTSSSVTIFNPPQITGPGQNAFMLGPGTCPPTLGPNGTCSVNVRFSPPNAGSFNAQVQVNNDAGSPAVRPLAGTGVPASLSLSPSNVDFGIVSVEEHDEISSVVVQNTGTATVQVNQVDIASPDSGAFQTDSGNCQPQNLAPGQTCSIPVHFEPQEARTYNATLHVRAAGNVDFQATLTGVGGVGDVVLTPNPLDFGRVPVGSSATATITARSTGNAPFQSIVTVLTGGDVGDLRVTRDMCSLRMLPFGQTCATTVRFTPTAVGPAEAVLVLISDNDGDPHFAMVRGEGTSPGPQPPRAEGARVAFSRKSKVARFSRGRVRLGKARCKGAPTCSVRVRSQFVVSVKGARRPYLVRGRAQHWTLGHRRPVSIALPPDVRDTALRVILSLKTSAPGLPATVQRKVLRLAPAKS